MTPELYVTLVVAVIAATGTIVGATRKSGRGRRDFIEQDLRILKELGATSASAKKLRASIESRVDAISSTASGTRSRTGIVLASILLALGLGLATWAFIRADGWSLPLGVGATFILILGGVGMAQDAVPRERDERGRPLK